MKKFVFLGISLLVFACNSNKVPADKNEVKTTEVVAKDFKEVSKPNLDDVKVETTVNTVWLTDMKPASELSLKKKKPLLMFFTGSDWCGWCTRLQNEVLKTKEFEAWAAKNVILVELDYPKRTAQEQSLKDQNMNLAQVFKISGFPTIHLVNPNKTDAGINLNSFGSFGYVTGGPTKWIEQADVFMASQKTK